MCQERTVLHPENAKSLVYHGFQIRVDALGWRWRSGRDSKSRPKSLKSNHLFVGFSGKDHEMYHLD